jgi:hypothetical protein
MSIHEVIPKNKIYSFKVKIVNTQLRHIMVGVVDQLIGRNNTHYSYNNSYSILYCGYNGHLYPKFGYYGDGFKSGDIVEVVVALSKAQIGFRVSGVTIAVISNCSVLAEANR